MVQQRSRELEGEGDFDEGVDFIYSYGMFEASGTRPGASGEGRGRSRPLVLQAEDASGVVAEVGDAESAARATEL